MSGWVTMQQAAAEVRVPHSTVWRMAHEKRIKVKKVGFSRLTKEGEKPKTRTRVLVSEVRGALRKSGRRRRGMVVKVRSEAKVAQEQGTETNVAWMEAASGERLGMAEVEKAPIEGLRAEMYDVVVGKITRDVLRKLSWLLLEVAAEAEAEAKK